MGTDIHCCASVGAYFLLPIPPFSSQFVLPLPWTMRPKKLIDIEKSLGFIWVSSIFGGVGGGCGVPIVEQFSNDVKLLTENFRDYQPNRLSKSTKFHVQCDELYRRHAPLLWPPKEVDRRDWLVNTDDNETGDGLYPRNLYYEDKGDT